MEIFEKSKIDLLREKIETIKVEAHSKGRYSLFDTKFSKDVFSKNVDYEKLSFMYDLINQWDEKFNLSYHTGISLDKLAEDYTVMFHRTNCNLDRKSEGFVDNDMIFNIMNEGLKNYGHANAIGGGVFSQNIPPLTLTMTPLKGLTGYINLISSYKSNDAIVFAFFPKQLVKEDGEIVEQSKYSEVYDLSQYPPKIKTEHMMGVILKKDNGFDEFYTRDEVINSRNIRNNK